MVQNIFLSLHRLTLSPILGGLLAVFVPVHGPAHGWGERGHHLVARNAALLMEDLSDSEAKAKGLASFFRARAHLFGHLANIPDISWRDTHTQSALSLAANAPTHYLDIEFLLGSPQKDKDKYMENIRQLPVDYPILKANFDGKKNPSQLQTKEAPPLKIYENVGTAPWRIRELYESMTKAFSCLKDIEKKHSAQMKEADQFKSLLAIESKSWRLPLYTSSLASNKFYSCDSDQSHLQALSAAIAIGGVMGHFVGDLSQPYHTTINYDGWATGNGKAYEFFETSVVNEQDSSFEHEVFRASKSTKIKRIFQRNLDTDWRTPGASARFALALAAHSWNYIPEAISLDKKYAIVKTIEGQAPQRRIPSSKSVVDNFKPLLTECLAMGSRALATIWYQSWVEGGKPDLSVFDPYSPPYLLDVPFLVPTYDPEAISRLSASSSKK